MSLDDAIKKMSDVIKSATFKPAIDMLNNDGMDIQVFVYDKDAPPLKG